MANKIKITLLRSHSGRSKSQRGALRALRLRKPRQTAIHPDNASVRGQLSKVLHLVEFEEVAE